MSKLFHRVLAFVLVAAIAFAPALAEARAGARAFSGGSAFSSFGSRGSQTYSPLPGASAIDRSVTPVSPSYPSSGPAWNNPAYGSGYGYPRSSFWPGFASGLFGAWLGSLLFGHSAYGYGYGMAGHGGGLFGTLILFFLLFWLGRMVWRSVAPGLGTGFPMARPVAGGYQPVPRVGRIQLTLDQRDYDAFGQVLTGVQTAWSNGDLATLQRYATPEMLSYFSELLSDNASRRLVNRVQNVSLLHGEPRDSWSEGNVDYATALLRWSAIDYTERMNQPGAVVTGDPRTPVIAAEFWTFRRAGGGRWLLSAIQQVR